jgi:hypothetical protein
VKGVLVAVLLLGWILSEKFRNPYYMSFVCGIVTFFLYRFLIAYTPRARRSSYRRRRRRVAKIAKTAYSGRIRSAKA